MSSRLSYRFIQESEGRVNNINERLRKDSYEVAKPGRLCGGWTFYFQASGGFKSASLA
jgi:hypothetical protein